MQFKLFLVSTANELLERFVWWHGEASLIELYTKTSVNHMQAATFDTRTVRIRDGCTLYDMVPVYASVLHFISHLCTSKGNGIFFSEIRSYGTNTSFIQAQAQHQMSSVININLLLTISNDIFIQDDGVWINVTAKMQFSLSNTENAFRFKRMALKDASFYEHSDWSKSIYAMYINT